jgi:subtilisin-like proprotein convertase family protein
MTFPVRPLILLLLSASWASAELTFAQFEVNAAIPDNDAAGLLNTQTVTSDITSIESITVTLNITGGWNGDLYAYVAHESGLAVLLNRVGKTSGNEFGSASSGFTVTFSDTALNGDIHTGSFASGTPITGIWAPDARTASPTSVTDASSRTAFLSTFHGLPASGTWELFVADVSGGDTSYLESWSMEISGSAGEVIPEPSAMLPLAALFATALWRRRR